MRLAALAFLIALPSAAIADLTVSFRDGAPKDRFTLSYDGVCALDDLDVQIDLGTAPAGLIFDTSGAGAGVEVFQPLEWVVGQRTHLSGYGRRHRFDHFTGRGGAGGKLGLHRRYRRHNQRSSDHGGRVRNGRRNAACRRTGGSF